MLNSPNNPSGVVYPEADVARAGGRADAGPKRGSGRRFSSSATNPTDALIYDGLVYPQVFPHYERTIVVNSHAKDLGLPGERIGHIAVHPDYSGKAVLMDALVFCNRVLGFVNAPALMQHVVRAVQDASVDVGEYQRKRDFMYDRPDHHGLLSGETTGSRSTCSRAIADGRRRGVSWPRCRSTTCWWCRARVSARRATSASRTAWTTGCWRVRWTDLRGRREEYLR